MLADDDGVGAVGGRSAGGGVPLLVSAPESLRRCDFGGRRPPLLVFAMPVLCFAMFTVVNTCKALPFVREAISNELNERNDAKCSMALNQAL